MKAVLRLCVVLEDKQPTQVVMIDDPRCKDCKHFDRKDD